MDDNNDYDSRNEVNESIEKENFNHETSNMGARMEPDQEDSVVVSEDEGSDCSTNATDDTKEGHDHQNRKVNKVLKMRFKRGMKQYLIHWADTDPTLDSWHFLNESFEGFHKEVKKFEDERKKLHLKGIGQSSDTLEKPAGKASSSSKQVKRAKHSWYYLSSSEDEDCMLKDNFWKNLDEGKLNLFQSSSDMYSGVKEAGRSVRSSSTRRDSNHSRVPGEVSAIIPEEFLAETKRVTRSKIQPINVKIKTFKVPTSNISKDKLKKTLDFKGLCNVDDDDDDNIQESKSKVASNISKKHGRKGNGDTTRKIKKSENRKTKSKTSKCVEHVNDDFITERSDVFVEEGEGRGDSDAEDEIGSSLVPTFREESISDRDPQQQQQQQHTNVHACYDDDGEGDGDGDDIVVPIAAATINNIDKNINTKVKSSEEALKHLDETLESVVHGSILWYEEHFASDDSADSSISIDDIDDDHHEDNCANDANGNSSELLQKDVSRKEITENVKMYNAENSEDSVHAADKFQKQQKKSSNKRKLFQTGWTSFLEGGSKKLKTKLEKFKDACVSDDDDEGDEGEDAGKQQKSNFQDNESCGHDVMCMNNAEGDEVVETSTVGGNVDMVNEDKSSVITPSLSATTLSVISSSSSSSLASTLSSSVSDLKVTLLEIHNDAKMERESASADVICAKAEDDKLEVSNTESSVKPMDDEAKMSLARRVSQAIMKSSHKNMDSEDLKITKSESQGNSHSKVERSVKSKSDERKSMFMMKLLEENDIKEKIQKLQSRTFISGKESIQNDLTNAVEANDIAKVKFLLTTLGQFPNKDITGSNLVWSAVKNGYNTMLSVLAMKNANLELKNKDGLTPLLYAAEKGLHTTVYTLIELGANMSVIAPDGSDVMIKAIRGNHKRVVHLLLGKGYNLSTPLPSSISRDGSVYLTQYCKQVNANDAAEVFHVFKMRYNNELVQKASQCFEGSLKIDLPVFPIQCLRVIDSDMFTIIFKHELQPTKKQKGMLLFVGHAVVAPHEVTCQLKGKSLLAKASLNDNPLSSISDDANFIYTFTPLVDGTNKLQLQTLPLNINNYQTCLIVCAYSITLSI